MKFNELNESLLLTEAFNSKPYDYEMYKQRNRTNFDFSDGSNDFRVQIATSEGLGTTVRRIYVSQKSGNVYRDNIARFANPMRIISTMLQITKEFMKSPEGLKVRGFSFDFSKASMGRAIPVIKKVIASQFRSGLFAIDVLDSNFKIAAKQDRSFIWAVRRDEDPAVVFNGKRTAGVFTMAHILGNKRPVEPTPEPEPVVVPETKPTPKPKHDPIVLSTPSAVATQDAKPIDQRNEEIEQEFLSKLKQYPKDDLGYREYVPNADEIAAIERLKSKGELNYVIQTTFGLYSIKLTVDRVAPKVDNTPEPTNGVNQMKASNNKRIAVYDNESGIIIAIGNDNQWSDEYIANLYRSGDTRELQNDDVYAPEGSNGQELVGKNIDDFIAIPRTWFNAQSGKMEPIATKYPKVDAQPKTVKELGYEWEYENIIEMSDVWTDGYRHIYSKRINRPDSSIPELYEHGHIEEYKIDGDFILVKLEGDTPREFRKFTDTTSHVSVTFAGNGRHMLERGESYEVIRNMKSMVEIRINGSIAKINKSTERLQGVKDYESPEFEINIASNVDTGSKLGKLATQDKTSNGENDMSNIETNNKDYVAYINSKLPKRIRDIAVLEARVYKALGENITISLIGDPRGFQDIEHNNKFRVTWMMHNSPESNSNHDLKFEYVNGLYKDLQTEIGAKKPALRKQKTFKDAADKLIAWFIKNEDGIFNALTVDGEPSQKQINQIKVRNNKMTLIRAAREYFANRSELKVSTTATGVVVIRSPYQHMIDLDRNGEDKVTYGHGENQIESTLENVNDLFDIVMDKIGKQAEF